MDQDISNDKILIRVATYDDNDQVTENLIFDFDNSGLPQP